MKSIADKICLWDGCGARLWSFVASHNVVTIRLHRVEVPGNLHIIIEGVMNISCQVNWMNTKIRIHETLSGIKIVDFAANVKIDGSSVRLEENVDPVY